MGKRKKRFLSSLPPSSKFYRAVAASSSRPRTRKSAVSPPGVAVVVPQLDVASVSSPSIDASQTNLDLSLVSVGPPRESPLVKSVDIVSPSSSSVPPVYASSVPSEESKEDALNQSSTPTKVELPSPSLKEDAGKSSSLPTSARKYSEVLHESSLLEELGTPTQHISGVPFVLIPDENLEEAKEEFQDFLFARFIGEAPEMGRIIGIVNAIWGRSGPRIFVHRLSPLTFLLRVVNPRTRAMVLARSVWIIAGCAMYVAPWAPEFAPEEPQMSSAVVPVELRGVPYLLFNKKSLSRLATAIGKPVSLAPETERKENFEVAKLWVRVDLLSELPTRIVSGFSNGREVDITVSYPWLPLKCGVCGKYGHESNICPTMTCPRNPKRSKSKESSSRRRSRQGRPLIHKTDSSHADMDAVGGQDGLENETEGDKTHTAMAIVDAENACTPMIVNNSDKLEKRPGSAIEVKDKVDDSVSQIVECGAPHLNSETPVLLESQHDINSKREKEPGEISPPGPNFTQEFRLERGWSASTIIVTHSEESCDGGTSGNPSEQASPFFLVPNRKSGRKVTRH
ncbi:hypothetical protein Bca52824_075009 [Brassica carinata]|uniref:DUF4283 domain-containing protein n=2 Tax=Brassica carinata TaxID=52824 RepID=A0A8X7PR17_BRACI|nr:hypothetical protein Bca52824_075009 [Brassica carinata]